MPYTRVIIIFKMILEIQSLTCKIQTRTPCTLIRTCMSLTVQTFSTLQFDRSTDIVTTITGKCLPNQRSLVYNILGLVSDKCPGFCKCLRFSKSVFATFSKSSGCQKGPALSSSDQHSMMVMETIYVKMIYNSRLIVHDKRNLNVS